jgi:hypothetical protein
MKPHSQIKDLKPKLWSFKKDRNQTIKQLPTLKCLIRVEQLQFENKVPH